ncbi:MAG: type III polyketide synthase [Terrimicrobiaceae bacterium]
MFLQSVASAFPSNSLSQSESWDLLRKTPAFDALRPRSRSLLEKILLGDSGIERRQFASPNPLALTAMDAESLHCEFEKFAPALASEALLSACTRAGVAPGDLDALIVCTCTGYLCPGVSSHVAESLGLKPDAFLQDLLGMGCGAAIPMLQAAKGVLAAKPDAVVATVAVEICSAAFYLDDDPGVLISLCLFGDGAAAAIWSAHDASGQFQMEGFRTIHQPEHREKIRFVNSGGKLKNQLDRAVPELAASAVSGLFDHRRAEPDAILAHTGGRDVLDAIERSIPGHSLDDSRAVLRDHGNMSSPCVLVALENSLDRHPKSQRLWLTAFGAGFAAHSCELFR